MLRKYGSDILSTALVCVALFLIAQPESQVRTLWRRHTSEMNLRAATAKAWPALSRTASPLWIGGGEAQVVEISDYECPFCRRNSTTVDSAVAAGIRVAYLHYPGPSHPQAKFAALAVICARAQGEFKAMHDYFMRDSTWRSGSEWEVHGARAGIQQPVKLLDCMGSSAAKDILSREMALGDSVLVSGTPTFVSRRGVHRGIATLEELRELSSER